MQREKLMKCSYCRKEDTDGKICTYCGDFICQECMVHFYVSCIECVKPMCTNCSLGGEICSCCGAHICPECYEVYLYVVCDDCGKVVCYRCFKEPVKEMGVYRFICDCCFFG